jgi:peptidoglycan/LPS O-acetylase OafA/YrhL
MTPPKTAAGQSTRLIELDALRGVAATLVMLFHYTTQYDKLFGHASIPLVAVPWGHFGVNLFFMISGFVIFMTLHRVTRPLDFVVSRFSRLFPAFWVAVVLSFALTHAFELPGKTVGLGTALLNLSMIHGLFKIAHVDNVYWTLEIELLFYGWALLLYGLGRLDQVHLVLAAALSLRLIYSLADRYAGIELSWTLSHLMILPYIAWFVCGIMIYRLTNFPGETPFKDLTVLIAATVVLAIVEAPEIGLLAAGMSSLLWAAANGKLPILANPFLAWLGAISYTLYLLHENIGWGIIMRAERAGIGTDVSILVAIVLLLALATGLTRHVERPAMKWLRDRYRASSFSGATAKN